MNKFAVVVSFAALFGPAFAQSRRFSADDLPKIVRISDPQISPDGKTVAVVVSRANMKDDRWDGEIEFIDIATGQARVMTHDQNLADNVSCCLPSTAYQLPQEMSLIAGADHD